MTNKLVTLLTFKNFLWLVYAGVLVVITPHTAWMFQQFEPADSTILPWIAALVFEASIYAATHLLVEHIKARRISSFNLEKGRLKPAFQWWPVFRYRWLSIYSAFVCVPVVISGLANLAHAVQFGQELRIVSQWGIPLGVLSVAFGGILPVVNLLFAAVIAQVEDAENETDPALEQAKAEKRDAEKRAKEAEKRMADLEKESERRLAEYEQALHESELRYHAIGDVVRFLFEKNDPLHDRILYARKAFPQLSQNGISQILGCSVSTVNEALRDALEVVPT